MVLLLRIGPARRNGNAWERKWMVCFILLHHSHPSLSPQTLEAWKCCQKGMETRIENPESDGMHGWIRWWTWRREAIESESCSLSLRVGWWWLPSFSRCVWPFTFMRTGRISDQRWMKCRRWTPPEDASACHDRWNLFPSLTPGRGEILSAGYSFYPLSRFLLERVGKNWYSRHQTRNPVPAEGDER